MIPEPMLRTPFAAVLPVLLCATAQAQNWPRFRGPGGQGYDGSLSLPAQVTAEHLSWKVELAAPGHSSPVVWEDRVFVTGHDADAAVCVLMCLGAGDGSEVWVQALEAEPYGMHDLNSYASTTPAVDGSRVAVTWRSGDTLRAAAFDLEGEPLWERALGATGAQHGGGASPVLHDGVLLVGNDTEEATSFLVGLDAQTGEIVWKVERETSRASFATPLVYSADGSDAARPEAIFASTAHGLTALDPRSGEKLWERPALFRPRCVASPAIADGILFTTAGSGGGGKVGVALALERRGPAGVPAEAYRLDRALPYVPSPIAHEGRLYLWSDGGIVSCSKLDTGGELWRERAGGTYYGSPVLADDRLWALDTEGTLVVVAAGDAFELLGRIELGEPSHATPAVGAGHIYLRTTHHLHALAGAR